MSNPHTSPAQLSKEALDALQNLENELGTVLVAYQQPKYAQLSDEQLKRLQSLEECLGTTVIAYQK